MTHPDRKTAKNIDTAGRCRAFTDIVYSGVGNTAELVRKMSEANDSFLPGPPSYHAYIGEMHGHTNLSDGGPDIDTYFQNIRNKTDLDFAAVSDHDHGGVGRPELWVGNPSKWDLIRQKVKEYYEPGHFTTILAYERDSYPFCNNMVIYYNSHDGEMIRGVRDGEITESEMRSVLSRDDIFVVPHDTYELSSSTDFSALPMDLMPPMMEIISRGDPAEYFGNPAFDAPNCIAGGFFQDALKRGAVMGCLGGSDDHSGLNGQIVEAYGYPKKYPGLTGVWASENTLPAIFDALKARRCYAFMGGRMVIDFRINGHYMGEVFSADPSEDLTVYFRIEADAPVKEVTVVKNCSDSARFFGKNACEHLYFDYRHDGSVNYYYLRVELADGRFGWTSPIWVR